ncbi:MULTISPECIES: GNAT family N-acetyltransferase [unclassified Pseudoalteromonas]|uniref:GNAT family N-acetyltransferase n=1 Tax=unclassified Pseudoalteromonas TaxID=194690 RepID=UPI002096C226|nr:GNAT family N-acetyltransferase [Pseudoalteromonas sp. XMcav2-N]MCO7187804.1 GNAT family N-acetyltransferase [Pseudoalteromonas sp. XMcav2-N]
MSNTYTIRTMTRAEVDLAVDWAAQEGWNPGLEDAQCYYQADPEGFLIGTVDDEPIAVISAVKYDDTFGFIGFYIVKPEYRGQGFGLKIWQAAMTRLAGCNIGLDGVVEQQENYKKSGFTLAYSNRRYQASSQMLAVRGTTEMTDLNALPHKTIERFLEPFFPVQRTRFWHAWQAQSNAISIGLLIGGELQGVGVIRQCREGYKIGPLFAQNAQQAEALIGTLSSKVGSDCAVYLDVPACNSSATGLAEKLNMTPVFDTARMYTQRGPDIGIDKTFGVTSFEIG